MGGLIYRSPVRDSLFSDLDDFLGSWVRGRGLACLSDQDSQSSWLPTVDIVENDDEFVVSVELAGVSREDIRIQVKDDAMSISGERKFSQEDKTAHRVERFYGRFSRSFTLPKNVRADEIRAESKDGVLNVHLPKRKNESAEAVDIKVD